MLEKTDIRILEILDIKISDAGIYKVTLENIMGKTESHVKLDVIVNSNLKKTSIVLNESSKFAPVFNQSISNTTGYLMNTSVLTCEVNGCPVPDVKWYKDGKSIKK